MKQSQHPTLQENMEQKARSFFMNESVNADAYRKAPLEEKVSNAIHGALCEFANASTVIDTLFKGRKAIDNEELAKISVKDNAYFKDIDKSAGDIKKTKHHTNMKNLLDYGVQMNASARRTTDAARQFDEAAHAILTCASMFERNSQRFRTIIMRENSTVNSKQLGTAFYRLSVYLLQTTADILYSNSLQAEFDYNQKVPVASNVYFEYNNGVVDEMLTYINYLNGAFRNGKIFNAIDGTLNEAFEDALDKISLNEGLLDTVFGMVTHFKALDLVVLWPIYLTRAMAYWVLYFYSSFKTINVDIDNSIKLQRQGVLGKAEYDTYKADASRRGMQAQQALARAEVTIDMSAKEDKKSLEQMQSNVLI